MGTKIGLNLRELRKKRGLIETTAYDWGKENDF